MDEPDSKRPRQTLRKKRIRSRFRIQLFLERPSDILNSSVTKLELGNEIDLVEVMPNGLSCFQDEVRGNKKSQDRTCRIVLPFTIEPRRNNVGVPL